MVQVAHSFGNSLCDFLWLVGVDNINIQYHDGLERRIFGVQRLAPVEPHNCELTTSSPLPIILIAFLLLNIFLTFLPLTVIFSVVLVRMLPILYYS